MPSYTCRRDLTRYDTDAKRPRCPKCLSIARLDVDPRTRGGKWKLNPHKVRQIRIGARTLKTPYKLMAKMYGVTRWHISNIVNRHSWKWVKDEYEPGDERRSDDHLVRMR